MPRTTFRFLILSIISCIAFLSSSAHAVENDTFTESEKVGFAFYGFAGTEPKFDTWIKNQTYYQTAKPSAKNHILYEDNIRLGKGFQSFNPEYDYISFETPARAHIPAPDARMEFLNKFNKIPIKIELPRILEIPGSQETYFPYEIGNTWIALIPDNFQEFLTIYMDEEDYYNFSTELGITYDTPHTRVMIEYIMRATNADSERPFPVGSKELWLVMAEVGGIKIRNPHNNYQVWDYESSWYIPKTRQNLMNLYRQ